MKTLILYCVFVMYITLYTTRCQCISSVL